MAHSMELSGHGLVAITRDSLTALRGALFRDLGANGAAYLQEAGYAGGAALFDAFERWLSRNGFGEAHSLPAEEFGRRATEFFRDAGWGSIEMGTIGHGVATLDSTDWSEAEPAAPLEFPGCHVSTGMFADFFGRLAGTPLAVMEVECRSMGAPRCRFLVAGMEVMQFVYDEMARGVGYEDAAGTVPE